MVLKCFLLAFLCLCPTLVQADMSDAFDTTIDAKKVAWMSRGMEAIKSKLKDPGSAKFRRVFFHRGVHDAPMTCGEVNAKNSFGGYNGFERFISAGSVELSFLESQVSDFQFVWGQFCQ